MASAVGVNRRVLDRLHSHAQYVVAASAQRLGKRPRLARLILRLPAFLPGSRLRAHFYRSFSWPLAKRLRAEIEVSVIGGSKIFVRTDDSIGRALAISGVWEPNVTAAFGRFLSPGDVCLDIGAHIGYYTLLASKLVGPEGHVYAFEPSPANYRALRANLGRNRVDNVTALEVAVGREAGTAVLYEGPGTNTGAATLNPFAVERHATRWDEVAVEVRTIATSVRARDFPRIRVIKIDVEGYEAEVVRSLAPLFDLGRTLAVFLEYTPGWIRDPEADQYVEDLSRVHRFEVHRLATGYSPEVLFPDRLEEPAKLDSIPRDQCDLLLTR